MKELPEIKIEVSIEKNNTLRLKSEWKMQSIGKKGPFVLRNGEYPFVYEYEEFILIKVTPPLN